MAKRALSVALGLSLLIGFSGRAAAEKVRMNYECTCTCVATDDKGTYASCTGRELGTPPKGGSPEPTATGH